MSPESLRRSAAPIEVRWRGTLDYRAAYDEQHALAEARARGDLDHDVLLLLEHPSTYTAGKRTEDSDLPTDGSEVITVDRGGRITWHGPGQLVGYPIVALREPLDVVEYVRRIEEALIGVCARLGVVAGRVDGRSGVWLDDSQDGSAPAYGGQRKIAQIGIRVAQGVALHGFAINVDPDLSAFDAIVPCGIADAGVTSLARELGRPITVGELRDDIAGAVAYSLDHPVSAVAASTQPSPQGSSL
ncbi:lipoyl(octanoyl) transferase LipB [Gordonia araii]|nr:lipoyl(octanoyl) transferase LipB [Gordonia araii]NNG97896.1 lipoyl(octanoyl) transferase LipB [Gordonia araii NBRC 100433]